MSEYLLTEENKRFVVFPIQNDKVYEMYKRAVASFWTPEEIDFSKDMEDWEKLNENEHYFIKNILAFFAASDGIVLENLGQRFMSEVQVPEAKFFYGFQIAIEAIHSETYSLMIDKYITDNEEKEKLLTSLDKRYTDNPGECLLFDWIEIIKDHLQQIDTKRICQDVIHCNESVISIPSKNQKRESLPLQGNQGRNNLFLSGRSSNTSGLKIGHFLISVFLKKFSLFSITFKVIFLSISIFLKL